MGSMALSELAYILAERGLNATDPRVGSARDNGSSTSALRITSGTNSPSISTLFTTLVPVSIYAAVCLTIFWVFRWRFPRVYAPRTILSSLEAHERASALPNGWIHWTKAFYKVPDIEILQKSSLDAFLFLRYLKILVVVCGVGCIITWPVLLPLHRYGGNGTKQLDMLTFGNVKDPRWYIVHACQAWIFFGFILYMISRECVYFINLRQAYLLSPYYADRLSSRTVLFTCVPNQILDERKLRKVFGDAAKHIWIPRHTHELDDLVKEREETATRLEKAELFLIRKVNNAYLRALKHGHPDITTQVWSQETATKESENWYSKDGISVDSTTPSSPKSLPVEKDVLTSLQTQSSNPETHNSPGLKTSYGLAGPPDVNGSVAAQWIPYEERPAHRPLKNYGKKVDTIKWTRTELKEMAPQIGKLRKAYRKGRGRPFPAVFIEFDTQSNAQSAYQTLAHHRANHMVADIVGVRPQEIIWPSLRMRWWERIVRRFAIQAVIAVMVIFWSLPAALIGSISSVKYLADTFVFLAWINDLPSIILGLISGLLPAVALSLLMALVPYLMRGCARLAGVPTVAKVELFTQNAYFVFQVVQVFLVTTLTSAASGAIGEILKNPLSVRELLSQNLPKASNFYVSYFILQGLAMSATRMAHLGSIIRHQLVPNAGSPRLINRKYHRLRFIHWGAVYPVFTNMGVIAISYALIAPIILGVAFLGFVLIYTTYRYNLLYIYSSENDARGLHYPRALKQTLTGLYLAEICMIGLFGLSAAFGPLVLMFGLVIFTALIHISLNEALSPLLYNLPRTLAVEEEYRQAGHNGLDYEEGDDIDVEDNDHDKPYDDDFDPGAPNPPIHDTTTVDRGLSDLQGKSSLAKFTTTNLMDFFRSKYATSSIPALIDRYDFWTPIISPLPSPSPNFILKWLHPEIFADYAVLRQTIPDYPPVVYEEGAIKEAFCPPSVSAKAPRLWLIRDEAGVSRQECRHTGSVITCRDEGAVFLRGGGVNVDVEKDWREDWEKVRF